MYFTLAWRNIWRNRRRSVITISSIIFAVLLACVMRSMQLGSYERMIDNAVRFYLGFIQVHSAILNRRDHALEEAVDSDRR